MKNALHAVRPHLSRSLAGFLAVASLAAVLTTGCGGGGGGDGLTGYDKPYPPADTSGAIWLSWRAPSERENGEALALADMSGYRIYWGPAENPSQNTITVSDPTVTAYLIDDVPPGTYDVAVTAVDSEGLESSLSNTMSKAVD